MEKVIQLQDLQPGTSYLVRARAINKFGAVSEWSQTFTLNVTGDDTKPSVPSAPTIQIAGPQKIVVSHDNTKDGGGDLEYDIASYKVFENTVDNNTTGTLIHTMSATRPGSGLDSFATVNVDVKDSDPSTTRYYYVTAVDVAGNESDPSPTATGVDITFFESAYISDLTADKIKTGTLQANEQIGVGTLSPIIIKSNSNSPHGQIYIGAGNYANIDTAFYVDSTGKFSLKDALTWDGTTLSINGYLQVGQALETGDAADDVNNNPTTIVGDKIRTGNLISNNYLRIDPAEDSGAEDLNGAPGDGDPDVQPTDYSYSGTWIDLDDGSIWSKNFYIDTSGNAVFKGNLFASRGIFSDYLTPAEGADTFNYKDPGDTSNQLRYPTLTVESTNTDDGYLVLFKNVGTDNGVEFYVKQGPETLENDQVNWRRGSLAHISDGQGGFVRLGAFPSSTGLTPGRLRIFSQDSPTGPKGEIYLDASRTYAQRLFITQPTTTGDFLADPITNFWKDPDGVSNGSKYFQVGQDGGSSIEVRRTSSVTSKVKITDYEIAGISRIVENSKVTIENVSTGIDSIQIGRDVGGTDRHGLYINSNNYWTLNDGGNRAQFRVGGTNKYIQYDQLSDTLNISGNLNAATGSFSGLITASTFQGGVFRTAGTTENRVEITGGADQDRITFPLKTNAYGQQLPVQEAEPAYIRIQPEDEGINVFDVDRILEISAPKIIQENVPWGQPKIFLRAATNSTINAADTIYMSATQFVINSVPPGETPTFSPVLKLNLKENTINDPPPIWVLGQSSFYRAEWYPIEVLGGGGGSGTVTSVGLSVPSGFSVSGSPITTSGTLAINFGNAPGSSQVLRSGSTTATGWGQITGNHINSGSVLDVSQVKASAGLFHDGAGTQVESWYGTRVSASAIPSSSTYPDNTLLVVV